MAYRMEYPRPDFVRREWACLNGTWEFCFKGEAWRTIEVPFAFQSNLSGIGDNRLCDHIWYRRQITIDPTWMDREILLHFGAVDYACRVLINGHLAGEHTGGSAPFSFPITELLEGRREAELSVCVYDPCEDECIPRGKQYWLEEPDSIWYKRTSGIWQSVWLEPVQKERFSYLHFTPDIDKGSVEVCFGTEGFVPGMCCELAIMFGEEKVFHGKFDVVKGENRVQINLFGNHIFRTMNHHTGWCWSPECPNLFDVQATLYLDDMKREFVESYFGMRKIETKDGKVYLNNRPYYQKLILDQGYWPDSLMTAASDDDFVKDIQMAKEMGFNGCRKHQKAEDPRFLYHADRLGYLVWSEIGACISYTGKAAQRTMREWSELLERDYNHPCIVAWVVLNESWGVPNIRFDKKQQAHSMALYYNLRSLDDTRLIVNNDGWELTKSDICAIHNYAHGGQEQIAMQQAFRKNLATKEALLHSMPAGRQIYADGYSHAGEPILLTEFGGIAFAQGDGKAWGYTTIGTAEELIETYKRLIRDIQDSESLFGYCYTQLSDVEQEVNGLLTYDRTYKVDPKEIKAINDSVWEC